MIRLSALLSSAILVGLFAYFMEVKFTTVSRNWSEPWLWWTLGFLWLFFFGPIFLGSLAHKAARHLERDAR